MTLFKQEEMEEFVPMFRLICATKPYYLFLLVLISTSLSAQGALEEQRLACFYYDKSSNAVTDSTFLPELPSVWARGDQNELIYALGEKKEGFFKVAGLVGKKQEFFGILPTQTPYAPTQKLAEHLCQNGLRYAFPNSMHKLKVIKIAVKSYFLSINSTTPVFKQTQAGRISKVIIFGDSLSDQNNLKNWLRFHPRSPYFAGRFSDGPVWPDYFNMVSGTSLQNWAVAGSVSKQYFDIDLSNKNLNQYIKIGFFSTMASDVKNQINRYHKIALNGQNLTEPESTLFSLWIGGNDYLTQFDSSSDADIFIDNPDDQRRGYKVVVRRVMNNISSNLSRLYKIGARNFMVATLPDLSVSPFMQRITTYHQGRTDSVEKKIFNLSTTMHKIMALHNASLRQLIYQFKSQHPDAAIMVFDANASVSEALAGKNNGTSFDYDFDSSLITSIDVGSHSMSLIKPCLTGFRTQEQQICPFPNRALFWDDVHPSSYGHCLIAYRIHLTLATHKLLPKPSFEQYLSLCRPEMLRTYKNTSLN